MSLTKDVCVNVPRDTQSLTTTTILLTETCAQHVFGDLATFYGPGRVKWLLKRCVYHNKRWSQRMQHEHHETFVLNTLRVSDVVNTLPQNRTPVIVFQFALSLKYFYNLLGYEPEIIDKNVLWFINKYSELTDEHEFTQIYNLQS